MWRNLNRKRTQWKKNLDIFFVRDKAFPKIAHLGRLFELGGFGGLKMREIR